MTNIINESTTGAPLIGALTPAQLAHYDACPSHWLARLNQEADPDAQLSRVIELTITAILEAGDHLVDDEDLRGALTIQHLARSVLSVIGTASPGHWNQYRSAKKLVMDWAEAHTKDDPETPPEDLAKVYEFGVKLSSDRQANVEVGIPVIHRDPENDNLSAGVFRTNHLPLTESELLTDLETGLVALAMAAIYPGQAVYVVHVNYLRSGLVVDVNFAHGELSTLDARLRSLADRMHVEVEREERPGQSCVVCPVRDECSSAQASLDADQVTGLSPKELNNRRWSLQDQIEKLKAQQAEADAQIEAYFKLGSAGSISGAGGKSAASHTTTRSYDPELVAKFIEKDKLAGIGARKILKNDWEEAVEAQTDPERKVEMLEAVKFTTKGRLSFRRPSAKDAE